MLSVHHPTQITHGVYAITPDWTDIERLYDAIEQVCEAGIALLQWRRKGTPVDLAIKQLEHVQSICHRHQIPLIINDDWQLAIAIHADGVHLGKDDGDILEISQRLRQQMPDNFIIGMSCYNRLDLLPLALKSQVDYIAFGALFASRVKPHAVHAPLSLFEAAKHFFTQQNAPMPALVGIGGINLKNAPKVIQSGATQIALISNLFEVENIYQTTRSFNTLFKGISC